jgi:hypothetical protein
MVCSTSITVTSKCRTILMLSANVGIKFSFIVWVGLVGGITLGPYVLAAHISRDFLETVLPEMLEDAPLAARHRLWFQYNGASAHHRLDVRQWLNGIYSGRCIRCRGPTSSSSDNRRSREITVRPALKWTETSSNTYC